MSKTVRGAKRMADDQSSDEPANDGKLDAAFAAYLKSCDTGQLKSREAFLAQFPELADQLSELIEAADMIGQFTSGGAITNQVAVPQQDPNDDDDDSGSLYQSTDVAQPSHDPSADTVGVFVGNQNDSGGDPAVTLPMANRSKDDPGPRLPFDLGDYVLLDVIGRGGMGVVYRAHQSELDRHVAVKMIRSGMLASDAEVKRFYTEAQAAARLHHPGIVSVYQFGQRAGHHFFSMEHIIGTDLQRLINSQHLDCTQAAEYVRDVARAIHHAHEKGVLHRDLKPANVLIDEKDQVHVTDFGLAKHLDCDSSVTASGDAVGTPHYMAPEQAGGQSDRASVHTDVYALGAILFASLAGRPPLVGDTVMQTLMKVLHDPAPAIRSIRRDVPIDLETIIAKCLEKKTSKRYETAEELADELDAFLEHRPIKARPRSAAMKTWHWIEGIPLVGALTGRRVLHSSDSHRRFQAVMLLLLCLVPLLLVAGFAVYQQYRDAMPSVVRIAGGIEGGLYTKISQELADRVAQTHQVATRVSGSGGSIDNRGRLIGGQIDLAPMQATAISGERVRVVAPLFYEALFVLARHDSDIESVDDLRNHRVAIGPDGSGSSATADLVFDSLGLTEQQVTCVNDSWEQLFESQTVDAAMICIGQGSQLVNRLVSSGRWRLVPIEDGIEISLQHPTLRPMTLDADDLGEYASTISGRYERGFPTVGTTAFLAARDDAPGEMVQAMLDALYQDPPPSIDLIPRRRAAEWQGLAFHPAARKYYRRTNP